MSESKTPRRISQLTNTEAMFAAWVKGATMEQIAAQWGVPIAEIQALAETHEWYDLRQTMLPAVRGPRELGVARNSVDEIMANRTENMRMFSTLRDSLIDKLVQLKNGKLRVERIIGTKDGPIVCDQAPTPSDYSSFASAAKIISEGTARCLGDHQANETSKGASANGAAMEVTVLLPAAVSGFSVTPTERVVLDATKDPRVIDVP